MNTQPDDIAVIQLVLQGQQSAFATLVERHQSYVFTLAMRYVNNREVAEELAQDVFLKAYRYLADFKGNSKFSTWLYTIVNTTCLSYLRSKKEGHILLTEEKLVSVSDSDIYELPSDSLDQKMRKIILEQAIKKLPVEDARILTLFYQAGQSVDEIGIIMGMTAANVKVRLFRARQKLKANLMYTDLKMEKTN